MALTSVVVQREAAAVQAVCAEAAALLARVERLLTHNSNLAIDWGAAQTPAYIPEEADGNLSGGFAFTRQAVSNAIGSLASFRDLMASGHLGNVNQLAPPL